MISPTERRSNPILSLFKVRLTALLVYVDRDGNYEPHEGIQGEVIQEDAIAVSEGALWVREGGDVVQRYPRGQSLLSFPGLIKPCPVSLEDVDLVVAGFDNGILGAHRGMAYATARVLTDLEAFHGLIGFSDEMLDRAIGSNLKSEVSVRQHRENIAELEALVRSKSALADEIASFLEKLKDPKDRNKRHNVYRMVLIVRAVQRRAKEISSGKGDTLEAVTQIGLDVARYVGAVTATASRVITELDDEQPWWTGQNGDLTARSAEQRRRNLVVRLKQYRHELVAMTAKPFRAWTVRAAEALGGMILGLEAAEYGDVITNARRAVALLDTVLTRESLSHCVSMAVRGGDNEARYKARGLLCDVNGWYIRCAAVLDLNHRAQPMYDRIFRVQGTDAWEAIEAAAREVERRFDALLD